MTTPLLSYGELAGPARSRVNTLMPTALPWARCFWSTGSCGRPEPARPVGLVVAVILVTCAFAGLGSKAFGRWAGIFAAAIAAISAIWWMPCYPVWAFTYMS